MRVIIILVGNFHPQSSKVSKFKATSYVGVSQLFIANKKDSTIMAFESKEELKQRLAVSLHLFTILVVALMYRTNSLSCR